MLNMNIVRNNRVILMVLSEVFKALGDETRLRIVRMLYKNELCVCQIIEALRITQPNASKHLNRLRYAGVISCRKISQWCFYSLSSQFSENNAELLEFVLNKCKNNTIYEEDLKRLEYVLQNSTCCQKQMRQFSKTV